MEAGEAIVRIFVPKLVDLTWPRATPAELVTSLGWVSVFPAPLAAKVAATPGIGFPKESLIVISTVAVATPSAATVVGDALIVLVPCDGTPGGVCAVIVRPPVPLLRGLSELSPQPVAAAVRARQKKTRGKARAISARPPKLFS